MADRTAELYLNKAYADGTHNARRWWAHDRILVGGTLLDAADWAHLKKDFGITAVLSVESEHDDNGKGIDGPALWLPVPDDGTPKPAEWWAAGTVFAAGVLDAPGSKLYVHCQMGGSRSPAMAFAILRTWGMLSREEALAAIRETIPHYGNHPVHVNYLSSCEHALSIMFGFAIGRV